MGITMKNKMLFIGIIACFALSVFSTVMQGISKHKQQKQVQQFLRLQQQFKLAQQTDSLYQIRLFQIVEKTSYQQAKIDSLNIVQSELNLKLLGRQKALQDIKKLLEKPQTNFADSTAQTILNNLPK